MKEKSMIDEWENIPNEARPKLRYWLPAAAVDENDLKEELKWLKVRGFGGVEISALTKSETILTGEDGWGTENWNRAIQVIADTAQKLEMSMDITNGPMWPVSMPTIKNADDPAASCELTYGITICPSDGYYKGKLPARRTIHKEGRPTLIQTMAYLQTKEKVLVMDSYRDLNRFVNGNDDQALLECLLPPTVADTSWLIFAFYQQPAAEKTGAAQYYVVDHYSKAGSEACEKYWAPLMKKYHNYPAMESFFCDSMEFKVCLDWTPKLPDEFEKRRGYSILPYLPLIGLKASYPEPDIPGYRFEDPHISDMINSDYLETLTQCYCEYHVAVLENMAKKYGKTVRYQVAYNKPLEVERSALCAGIPENEALGRPALDYLKVMASAAHLGRKRKYSFECSAEYANAYGQDYEDLFWWVNRALISGMNAQVLHGGSYSGAYQGKYSENGHIPGVEWPGYEAFRKAVSNYWNRTLSVEDARGCLDTMARMNSLFMKKAKIDCAIYRSSYSNPGTGGEGCLFDDDGLLAKNGYSYETVSPALLDLPVCRVENGVLDSDGIGYKCLIVPEQKAVSLTFIQKVQELLEHNFPVVWIGQKPCCGLYYSEWKTPEDRKKWQKQMELLWKAGKLIHINSIKETAKTLKEHHILPNIQLEGKMDIMTALRTDEDKKINYYALYAYNRISYTPETPNPELSGPAAPYQKDSVKPSYKRPGIISQREISVKLTGTGQVYQCNPWSGRITPLDFTEENGFLSGKITIEKDEMVLLALAEQSAVTMQQTVMDSVRSGIKKPEKQYQILFDYLELECFVPDCEEETSFLRSHFSEDKILLPLKELLPWRQIDPALEQFAGRGTYFGSFFLDKKLAGKRYVLKLGAASDTFHVCVNGFRAEFPDQVLKETDITELITEGANKLQIIVVSNLYNCLLGPERDKNDAYFKRPIPYIPKDYGIWNTPDSQIGILVL